MERLVETEVSLKIGNMRKKKQWIFIMLQSCLQMDILWAGIAVCFFFNDFILFFFYIFRLFNMLC